MSQVAATLDQDILPAVSHEAEGANPAMMIFAMLVLVTAVVAAAYVFGYAAVIIYALAATFSMLVTLVVLCAGW